MAQPDGARRGKCHPNQRPPASRRCEDGHGNGGGKEGMMEYWNNGMSGSPSHSEPHFLAKSFQYSKHSNIPWQVAAEPLRLSRRSRWINLDLAIGV